MAHYRGDAPPRAIAHVFGSVHPLAAGASLAAFCRIHGLLLGNIAGVPRRKLLTLELGERLCDTYETYRACFPPSELEIEELLSFNLGIAENEVIALGRCTSCSGTVLIYRLAPHRPTCAHCQRSNVER